MPASEWEAYAVDAPSLEDVVKGCAIAVGKVHKRKRSQQELFLGTQAGRGRGAAVREEASLFGVPPGAARTARPGDVVLAMSNGAFGDIWGKLREALET